MSKKTKQGPQLREQIVVNAAGLERAVESATEALRSLEVMRREVRKARPTSFKEWNLLEFKIRRALMEANREMEMSYYISQSLDGQTLDEEEDK